jgi:hypothetical protein
VECGGRIEGYWSGGMNVCLTCGKSWQPPQKWMARYKHCLECRDKYKHGLIIKECEQCGCEIHVMSPMRQYCDDCMKKRNSNSHPHHAQYHGARIGFVDFRPSTCEKCEYCNQCREIVRTTLPLFCQVEDLHWQGGINPGVMLWEEW